MSNLQKTIEDMGFETRSYSGRGMYGKECLGVVVSDPFMFVFELGHALGSNDDYLPESVKTDNMGHDTIVYFPGVEWSDMENEDDEDDEDDD